MSLLGRCRVLSTLLVATLGACGDVVAVDAGSGPDSTADAGPGRCFDVASRSVTRLEIDAIGGAPIYPDLTLGPDDRPWVVFTKGTSSSRYAAVAHHDGVAWSPPEPVEQQAGAFLGQRPSIAIEDDGTVHVVAYDQDGCRPRYSTRSANGAWSAEALYLDGVDAGDHSNLVLDRAGNLHLSFTEYGAYRIVYGVRTGGAWQFEVVGTGEGVRAASSSLAVDATGVPHLGFYTGTPEPVLRYAVRGAAGWTVEDADLTVDGGHYPSLVLDAAGAPRIAALRWPAEQSELRLASRAQTGWQAEVVDSGLGITYTTGLAVLPCGTTLVAYARNEGEGAQGLWLAHRNPGETDWTRTSLDDRSYVSGIDLVVAGDGRVHLVYLDESSFILRHASL